MLQRLKGISSIPLPQAGFGLLALLLLIGLATGAKPWDAGLAAAARAGEKLTLSHFITSGLWWASLGNLLLSLLLVAGWPSFFSRPLPRPRPSEGQSLPPASWLTLLLAAAILLGFAGPRMGQSLWSDEEYTMRRSVFEDYNRKSIEDAGLSRRPVKWRDTLWDYKKPNNHVGYSILARLVHNAVPPSSDPRDFRFREPLLRLPALLAGLAGLAGLALLLHQAGFTRAARVAPVLLALHPWYLRYASEARGYSLAMALFTFTLWLLLRALERGRWRDWTGFGACQFYLLYSCPAALPGVVAINVMAVVLLLVQPPDGRPVLAGRWFVACVAGAMAFLQLMAPNLLQLREFLPSMQTRGSVDGRWVLDEIALFSSGQPWFPWDAANPHCRSLLQWIAAAPWFALPALGVLAVATGSGAWRLARRHLRSRLLLAVFLLPAPLMTLGAALGDSYLYPWYLIFALPGVLAVMAVGLEALPPRFFPPGVALLFLAFAPLTQPVRTVLARHPVEPMRESVRLTRETVNVAAPGIHEVVTVGFVQYTRGYDPAFHQVRSLEELERVIAFAEARNRPLFVNYAMPELARLVLPGVMSLIDDPERFEEVGHGPLHGLEPQNTRFVKRYVGGR